MARARKKKLKIYLTSWQKRMVADFATKATLGNIRRRDLAAVEIAWRPGDCLASYKLPALGVVKDDWMLYLTDEQVKMVSTELGLRQKVTAINISARDVEAGAIAFA